MSTRDVTTPWFYGGRGEAGGGSSAVQLVTEVTLYPCFGHVQSKDGACALSRSVDCTNLDSLKLLRTRPGAALRARRAASYQAAVTTTVLPKGGAGQAVLIPLHWNFTGDSRAGRQGNTPEAAGSFCHISDTPAGATAYPVQSCCVTDGSFRCRRDDRSVVISVKRIYCGASLRAHADPWASL